MEQAYIVILRQSSTFTRSNIESLKGWEAMLESLELIALMKGIKGLILRHENTEYLYMGIRSSLRGFLNLHQGGTTVTEYQYKWTANKELSDDFGHKVGESDRATDQAWDTSGIKTSDKDYDKKRADAREVRREKHLTATFLLRADIRQYRGTITHLRNDYVKDQQKYPPTVQKVQSLLMAWEG